MLSDRLERIKKILLDEKQIEVPTLSEQLGVSEVTIRRDLDRLEKEGFLKKTYGGAIIVETSVNNNGIFQLLNNENDELKDERATIGQIALRRIYIYIIGLKDSPG